jgi:hypothetical protein
MNRFVRFHYVPATWLELDGSDEITTVRGTLSETLEKLDAGGR